MIDIVFAICTTAALDNCVATKKVQMPPSVTMESCGKIRQMILDDQYGPLILEPGFNKVECEKH